VRETQRRTGKKDFNLDTGGKEVGDLGEGNEVTKMSCKETKAKLAKTVVLPGKLQHASARSSGVRGKGK
jgi:hypothetical protein